MTEIEDFSVELQQALRGLPPALLVELREMIDHKSLNEAYIDEGYDARLLEESEAWMKAYKAIWKRLLGGGEIK